MASLIPPSGILLNIADTAPAPSKDYCQLVVTHDQVIYRWWKITPRTTDHGRLSPGEIKDSYDDFLCDERVQRDIRQVFGPHTLDYVIGVASGHIDYLPRMPKDLLMKMIVKLDLEDIHTLAQTNRLFRKLCLSNTVWENIYSAHSGTPITEELRSLADAVGWRKLFFTNKLQLQRQLRRQRKNSLGNNNSYIQSEDLDLISVTGSEFNYGRDSPAKDSPAFMTQDSD